MVCFVVTLFIIRIITAEKRIVCADVLILSGFDHSSHFLCVAFLELHGAAAIPPKLKVSGCRFCSFCFVLVFACL